MRDRFPIFNLQNVQACIRRGYFYLGTPYTHYPYGREAAFRMAAAIRGSLIRREIPIFSPIVHSHPVAKFSGLDPTNRDLWMNDHYPMMAGAHAGLIVAQISGWEASEGLRAEIAFFTARNRPILALPLPAIAGFFIQDGILQNPEQI